MARRPSLELRDRMLANETIEPKLLEAVRREREGQHHDFKSGRTAKLEDVIREYVSAFANADGGTLVVGVDNEPIDGVRPVDGVSIKGETELADWAGQVLDPMAAYLVPFPKIDVVPCQTPAGETRDVLLIATGRAPTWVYDARSRRYHVRVGHQTIAASEALVADVLHGRRRRPHLELHVEPSTPWRVKAGRGDGSWRLILPLVIHNPSLVEAEDLTIGVVALTWGQVEHSAGSPAPAAVLAHVRSERPDPWKQEGWSPAHWSDRQGLTLAPFATSKRVNMFCARLPGTAAEIEAAIYLLPRGSMPQWFRFVAYAHGHTADDVEITRYELEPAISAPPVLRWTKTMRPR